MKQRSVALVLLFVFLFHILRNLSGAYYLVLAGFCGLFFLLFIFHRKVKTTGFQPVSFSATMRGWRASAWITDTAVIRSTRS
ncbi:hypothetical protein, partial [Pseudomonas aeruginosa]|uniref:hypothetical protein n=1 Tax=Pseudomonas aeruginosa TaxID=287 RepID=UPI001F26506F